MDRSRIRGPYVRFCERDEARLISTPHPTRCLPSVAGNPGLLKETGVAPTKGKTIRFARALLATAGSEGSDRK
jgi:hypothetical protein